MLPPVEEAVLRNNPDFAALYTTLTTVLLNADGSSKSGAGAKERTAVREEANKIRLRAAKNHLLVTALANAAPPTQPSPSATTAAAAAAVAVPALPAVNGRPGVAARRLARAAGRPPQLPPLAPPPARAAAAVPDLPPELADLLLLLPPLLAAEGGGDGEDGAAPSLTPADLALLLSSPPLSSLPTHLPRLGALVAASLQASALAVARVAHPSTNPSYLHRTVPGLPAHAAALQQAVADTKAKLAATRHAVATEVLAVLDQQAAALSSLLRTLEAKHGPVARSLELRAAEVALDAQAAAVDAQGTHAAARRAVYPAGAEQALRNYAIHLKDSKMRLEEVLRERKALLREYGVGVEDDGDGDSDSDGDGGSETRPGVVDDKGRAMREMARVYREMGQQVEEVRGDLARLGRR